MYRKLRSKKMIFLMLTAMLFAMAGNGFSDEVNCSGCHEKPLKNTLFKHAGVSEKAVGVMDKGQLQNNTGNFGELASFFSWFTNAGHWPRSAASTRQYFFGMGLLVGINENNVIETVNQAGTKLLDWLPPSDASEKQYSGIIKAISDDTPFQASSDFKETWPLGYYDSESWVSDDEHHWPGYHAIDLNHPDYPETVIEKEGSFISDRDIYCSYNDDSNPKGSANITVEQTGYSYGRPYAEDFIFFNLKISNTGLTDHDSVYVGLYSKFRPDYDNHDYVNFVDSDGDGIKDLIVIYDINNAANQVWNLTADKDPLGMVGLRIYDTPHDMGVTNFHHFANEVKPGTDEELWAIMTSDTASSALKNSDFYFHGENYRIDNTDEANRGLYYPATTYEETDPPYSAELEGDAVNTIWSVGPFSLKADSSVTLSVGLIMGDAGNIPMQPDFTDLMSNVAIANSMHELFFQGSGPPEAPKVYAVAGDKKAILYWDSDPSESSVDAMTGEKDFEGYKIFRSTDMGATWGDPITNVYGEIVGYTPLATFDLINDIEGIDPAFPQHLGTNTGLVHTFIDSNLMNGLEYWYCISSYDKGRNVMDGDEQILEQSYIYPLGSSIFENHTVSVIPGIIANNITEATAPVGNLIPTNGITDGIVNIEIMDPDKITGHDYEITISEDALKISETGDTSYVMGFNLVNKTRGDTLLLNHLFSDATEDNIPVVDGFRLKIQNSKTGISSIGWTKVAGDTCTFDWRWHNKYSGADIVPPEISTFDDWRITVDYNTGFEAQWFDYFSGTVQESKQHMPLKIEIITDQENPIDASEDTWLYEFAINAPWATYRIGYYSKLGWDLVPGGLGYNAAMTGFYEKYPDVIVLEKIQTEAATGDTIPNYMYLFTNNKPDTSYNKEGEMEIIDAKAPSDGDEFTIRTFKPLRKGIAFNFSTAAREVASVETTTNLLDKMRVVPDPYIVSNSVETNEFGKRLKFNHLPDKCTIRIFTMAGDYISTVEHDGPTGYEFWNMRTRNDQYLAAGVYLYHASTPDGQTKTGRFLVIR